LNLPDQGKAATKRVLSVHTLILQVVGSCWMYFIVVLNCIWIHTDILNFCRTRERCSTSTADIGMWDNWDLS